MRTVTRIALLTVLAAACGKKAEAPVPAPSQDVELVRLGAMPHQILRYQLTKGVKTAIEMELDLEMSGPGLQRTMPTTVTVMELGAEDVLPDGSAKVRTTILRASARERPGAQVPLESVNAQRMMLNGIEITGTLTPRGQIQGVRLTGGPALPPKLAEGFAAMVAQAEEVAMPLPEPAVGVGAVWRVRRDATQLGIKMETLTEIEVTALEDRRVTFALRTEVRGADQRATIEGVTVDVKRVRGSGTGTGVIELGRMVIFGEQSLELGFDLEAADQSGSVKMRTAKRMKPATDAAAAPAALGKPQDPGKH